MVIKPVCRPFRRSVCVPGSKSITNRALPLAALAEGASELTGVLFADDTERMLEALGTLGYTLDIDRPGRCVRITGRGTQFPTSASELACGNSGTTIRFLAAMLTVGQGTFTLDGVPRMRERPIGQLVEQLTTLGARIEYLTKPGYPPLVVRASGLAGGSCVFEGAQSSQYISAVLLAAPYARSTVRVKLVGPVTSEPYVQMTLLMMQQFGYRGLVVQAKPGERTLTLSPGHYESREYAIEPDASNASYFLTAAALSKGSSITIENLGKNSLQGDVAFADLLHEMGAGLVFGSDFVTVTGVGPLHGIDMDMNHIPDMAQTLAVAALFAQGPTTIRNVANLRIKETDRLAALETELCKFGAQVSTTTDSITIIPPKTPHAPAGGVETYDDHRMAMAFGVAGLFVEGVRINNPQCTAKTYPEFFTDLAHATA